MEAPVFPTELWVLIVNYLHPQPVYYVGDACCGGRWSPGPGSSLSVGPLAIRPSRDLAALSTTCRFFHSLLSEEVSFADLYICLRDGELVRHNGGAYPAPYHRPLSFFPLDGIPLGPQTRRLGLALYVDDGPESKGPTQKDLDDLADAAADRVLDIVPNLMAIDIHLRFGCSGNGHTLSPKMMRALARLHRLVDIRFSGCHLPDLPGVVLASVERLETTHVVTSFAAFPRLRELRNDQYWLEQDAYRIPPSTFRNLEVVHYCAPDHIDCLNWFPGDCVALRTTAAQWGRKIPVRELVFRHSIDPDHASTIIKALASPGMQVFVCNGLIQSLDRYDEILALAKKSFPNAAIDFVDFRAKKSHAH